MRISRIRETCIYVSDLDRTREFYETKLGLEFYSMAPGRHVFFKAGESMLLCFNPDDSRIKTSLPPHYGTGKIHFAFECEPGEYEGWKEKLSSNGIEITMEYNWGKFRSFYFEDPDGHVLEILEGNIWE